MAQAASAEGVSKEVLSRAKSLGCPNFQGSRVKADGLKQWIADNHEQMIAEGGKTLKDQKTGLEIRKLKRIEDTADRALVKKVEVANAIRRILGRVAAISESKLVNEWPIAVAGLDVPEARAYGRRLHDSLMEEYQKLGKEFPE